MILIFLERTDMTTVSIDKAILEDLIDFKIRHLNRRIQKILSKWKYQSSDTFLNDAINGIIKEAEMDAIGLRQLIKQRDDLQKLKWDCRGFQKCLLMLN